jgi:hypothetical protein
MINGDKSVHVTHREFYIALSVIWLYIMLIIGDKLRLEERWSTAMLWLMALIMVFWYSAKGIRCAR